MAEAKQKADWDRSSAWMALYCNIHSTKRTFTPGEFNPFRRETSKPTPLTKKQSMAALKSFASALKIRGRHQ